METCIITDPQGNEVIALENVYFHRESNSFCGTCLRKSIPDELQAHLAAAHELIDGMSMGSRLSDIQRKIDDWGLKATFESGRTTQIHDLYINELDGVSFRSVEHEARLKDNGT